MMQAHRVASGYLQGRYSGDDVERIAADYTDANAFKQQVKIHIQQRKQYIPRLQGRLRGALHNLKFSDMGDRQQHTQRRKIAKLQDELNHALGRQRANVC